VTTGAGEPPRYGDDLAPPPATRPDAAAEMADPARMPAGAPVRPPEPTAPRPAEAPPPPTRPTTSPSPSPRPTTAGSRPAAPPGPATAVGVGAPLPAGRRGAGRRARLTVKRIDPWSTLKFAFVYSLAGLVVLLVAVVALYAVVDAMGVIDSIRTFLNDVDQPNSGQGVAVWLSFGRVLTVAIVVGVVNVILFTAFATLTAFVYNVCTELVGGVEVTLAERS
jgi:hypothetical protein